MCDSMDGGVIIGRSMAARRYGDPYDKPTVANYQTGPEPVATHIAKFLGIDDILAWANASKYDYVQKAVRLRAVEELVIDRWNPVLLLLGEMASLKRLEIKFMMDEPYTERSQSFDAFVNILRANKWHIREVTFITPEMGRRDDLLRVMEALTGATLLTRLVFSDCDIQDMDLKMDHRADFPELHTVKFGYLRDDSVLQWIGHTPRLQDITFQSCDFSSEAVIRFCSPLANLSHLRVDNLFTRKSINSATLIAIADAQLRRNNPQLIEVEFSISEIPAESSLRDLVERLPKLRLLDLSGTDGIVDDDAEAIIEHCPSIEVINLSQSGEYGGYTFSKYAIRRLLNNCPKLQLLINQDEEKLTKP